MTLYVDTAVVMYAGGAEHPLRAPSREILTAVADRVIDAVISAEVVQEIFHRFLHIGRRDIAVEMATAALDLFAPVLPITDVIMRRVSDLAAHHVGLSARDLVHAATCLDRRLEAIVSPDTAFDSVPGLARIAPAALL